MDTTLLGDLAAYLAANFVELSLFVVFGIVAGTAFPLALLCKRSLQRTGHFLPEAERRRHRARHALVLAACVAAPWAAFFLGRWVDGSQIENQHALVLVAASIATIHILMRRWRLLPGRDRAAE